jgi:hypothetical protein
MRTRLGNATSIRAISRGLRGSSDRNSPTPHAEPLEARLSDGPGADSGASGRARPARGRPRFCTSGCSRAHSLGKTTGTFASQLRHTFPDFRSSNRLGRSYRALASSRLKTLTVACSLRTL